MTLEIGKELIAGGGGRMQSNFEFQGAAQPWCVQESMAGKSYAF